MVNDEAMEAERGPLEITATPAAMPPGMHEATSEESGITEPPDQPDSEEDGEETLEIVAQESSGPPPGALTNVTVARVSAPPRPGAAPGSRPPADEHPEDRHWADDDGAPEAEPAPEIVEEASGGRAHRIRNRREARRRDRESRRRPPRAASPPPSMAPAPAVRTAAPSGGDSLAPAAVLESVAPSSGGGGMPLDGRHMGGLPALENQQQIPTSLLTAATVPDVDRRAEYLGYLSRHSNERSHLVLDLSRRVRFRVVDGQGSPIHDALLTLIGGGARVEGRTHADGWWDFFPSVSAPQAGGSMVVYIQTGSTTAQATVPIPARGDGRDIIIRLPQAAAVSPAVLDLAFLIDVTGSMGDELRYVNEEVVGIVARVRAAVPQTQVRVAATFYRDRGDAVPIEQIPFSNDVQAFESHMRLVQATGGGDYPEDLNMGLAAALTTLQWSQNQAVRVLVVIADAPPQMYPGFPYTYHHGMADASRRGIRILPVGASGTDRITEYLFRAMGAFTSTPYAYLTDDSGVGGSHMEADTDRIAVEMFSEMLTRMLIADLRGQGMHEPAGIQDVVIVPMP